MSASPSPAYETMQAPDPSTLQTAVDRRVRHKMVAVGGVDIFYREAGPKDAPTLLLLHGFPTSSHMFRELIPQLADRYHVIAPDYPGFGHSAAPDPEAFTYSFDNLAAVMGAFTEQLGLNRYALYMMDYGAPVGFRMATRNPDRVTALIIQNGNAYEEGLSAALDPMRAYWRTGAAQERDVVRAMLTPEGTKAQYVTGVSDTSRLNPDTWAFDQALLDRPGNADIQLALFYDYRNNPPLYPKWQAWLRQQQPPTLIVWGKNDAIFVEAGGAAYRRDLPEAEIHMLDTGHFALETHGDEIASLMRGFLGRTLKPTPKSAIEGCRP